MNHQLPETLTLLQAFEAMLNFLRRRQIETQSVEIGDLLLGLGYRDVNAAGEPATLVPGEWDDWLDAVREVLRSA